MNKVMFIGRLCFDPELRYTSSGKAVMEISVAVNRKYTGSDGTDKEETAFVPVTFWSRRAEVVATYFRKGDPIAVEGRLVTDEWEKDGQKRSKLKVIAEGFDFCGDTRGNKDEVSVRRQEPQPEPPLGGRVWTGSEQGYAPPPPDESDIPF